MTDVSTFLSSCAALHATLYCVILIQQGTIRSSSIFVDSVPLPQLHVTSCAGCSVWTLERSGQKTNLLLRYRSRIWTHYRIMNKRLPPKKFLSRITRGWSLLELNLKIQSQIIGWEGKQWFSTCVLYPKITDADLYIYLQVWCKGRAR